MSDAQNEPTDSRPTIPTPSERDREMAREACHGISADIESIAAALAQARAEERERAIGIIEYSVDDTHDREKTVARIRDENYGQHTNRARAAEGE